MIMKPLHSALLLAVLSVSVFCQEESERTCGYTELLKADQIVPISERMTPLDDTNTNNLPKVVAEWDKWGKDDFYRGEKAKDQDQVECWKKLAESGAKDLGGAFLRGAMLEGFSLSDVDLSGSALGNSDLSNAKLNNANLRGADLTGANLTDAVLTGATVSKLTTKGVDFVDWKRRGGTVVD